jgi:hypothetical protein
MRCMLLNNLDHRDLRVRTDRGPALGDAVMSAVTFPAEFRSVQAHYPIVFQRSADGLGFQPLALFGFEPGENLFLGDGDDDGEDDGKGRWAVDYLPMSIEREPFLIGRDGDALMVHVDLDSPRIAKGADDPAGAAPEPLFRTHGGTTDFLDRINSLLLALHEGLQATPAFIAALLEHRLLESFVFDAELDDGATHRLAGFHTIDEDRFAALDGAVLEQLNRAGHLVPICMVMASASNFRDLVARRNRRA